MELLLKQGSSVLITEEVVRAAAGNWGNGGKVMALLLKEQPDVLITEEVVRAAAGNSWNREEVMALLLEKLEFPISEEVAIEIAKRFGQKVMALLLKKQAEVLISEEANREEVNEQEDGEKEDGEEEDSGEEVNEEEVTKLPWHIKPRTCLYHDRMITGPLWEWNDALTTHQNKLSNWVITKVEHMKNFHFSAVQHQFLRFTVKQRNMPFQEPNYLFVERIDYDDTVTVGWKCVQYPKLSGCWIKRLLQGHFSDTAGGGVPVLASSSSVADWKAIGH